MQDQHECQLNDRSKAIVSALMSAEHNSEVYDALLHIHIGNLEIMREMIDFILHTLEEHEDGQS
jgi:hypothetical protein